MKRPPKDLQRGFIESPQLISTASRHTTIDHICKVTKHEKMCGLNIQSKQSKAGQEWKNSAGYLEIVSLWMFAPMHGTVGAFYTAIAL